MPRRKEPRIPDAVLDQLLARADPKTAFDPNGLLDDLKKALAERVLNPEMDHHLTGEEPGNRRNGYGKKTVITNTGQIELEVPRDRQARFDPQLIAKYQRRFPGFDDKIISIVLAETRPDSRCWLFDPCGTCHPFSSGDQFVLCERERVKKGLHRGLAEAPAAVMRPLLVVVDEPGIEIGLQFLDRAIDLFTERH